MRNRWLLCVLLGTLAWGLKAPEKAPAQSSPPPGQSTAAKTPATAEVAESAVVLTIKGVCSPEVKSAAKASAKTAGAVTKKPVECKTEVTRAQFEKIASALSPNMTPQLKRQLENVLPRFMAMSDAAKAEGLDKTPHFEEMMKIVRMQVLTQELQRSVQEQAEKISAEDIEKYYKEHPEAYQQYSLDRLFIPRFKQAEPEKEDTKDMTEDQKKAKEAAAKAKQEQGEQEMNKLADSLRAEAASGTDFAKLQKEAFEAAGQKVDNPTVNLPKVRRSGLPPAHAAVFELKVSEVSQVISDNGGHYVYKVVSKQVLPLDQVKDEIHNKLKADRMKEMMDKYTNSFESIPNEAYFGPPAGPPGMMRGGPPHLPPHSAQPAANPSSQPAAQAPPSNQN
jgi:PPIC-type PPIASE domain